MNNTDEKDGAVSTPQGDIRSTIPSIDIDLLKTDPLALTNELLSIAAASVHIKKITVEEEHKSYMPRPQLHILISAPFGNVKSTMLGGITSSVDCYKVDNATFPSLVGTIDWKVRQFVPAATWKARNKVLVLDEFNPYRDPRVNDAMLQLLEDQKHSRELGYTIELNHEEADGELYFRATSNRLELKTRFSCILATMHDIRNIGDGDHLAFISRFLPISYKLTMDDMDEILAGKDFLRIKQYTVGASVDISLSEYQRVRQIVKDSLRSTDLAIDVQTQWYMRAVNDALRVYAVTKNFDIIPIVTKLKATIGDMSALQHG